MKRRTYSVRQIQRLVERLDDDCKIAEVVFAAQRSLIARRWYRGNSLANCAGYTSAPVDIVLAESYLRQHVNERLKP